MLMLKVLMELISLVVVLILQNYLEVYLILRYFIGSTFNDGQAGTVTIDNAKVIDTQIIAEGNEHVMIFVGGVMGNTCWAGTANINNAYVVGCSIESHLYVSMNVPDDPRINSCAAGIMGRTTATSNIRYSAVIDTNIFISS